MSDDLIRRSDAIEEVSIPCGTCLARDSKDCEKCSVPKLNELINAIPSAQPKIVRCKDCKFNYGNEHNCSFNPNDIVCTYWESDGLQSDDFCSMGERSE